MGLLDELKQQAESQKNQQQSIANDRSRILAAVHAALADAQRYFTELAASLNVIKPEVIRTYVVHGSTALENLGAAEYVVREKKKTVEFRDYFEQVTLRFHYLGGTGASVETYSPEATRTLQNYLQGYGLRFDYREFKNERGVALRARFDLMPDVPASVTLTGDLDAGLVKLLLRNIDRIGDIEYRFEPEEVNRELLDEIAKLLLGKPSNVRNMGKHQQAMRAAPPRRVPAAALAEREPEAPETEAPAQSAAEKTGLFGTLKSLLKK